jgi:4-hydroxy-tetrahydrodipicolinate reductase
MSEIKVIIHGALGKVGKELMSALPKEAGLKLVGAVDVRASQPYIMAEDEVKVPLSNDLPSMIEASHPQVLVDFTIAEASIAAARIALKQGINLVIGTTGLSEGDIKEIDELAKENKAGVFIAPNFALGAVLLMHLATIASKYFDHAEIIELHHNEKADAPSGTALNTADLMLRARGKPFLHATTSKEKLSGCRGGYTDGIAIHSVRLPGFVASQEVIFGGKGQTLSLRHDTTGRECFVPGIILAIKEVVKFQGLIFGLDKLLHLGGNDGSL